MLVTDLAEQDAKKTPAQRAAPETPLFSHPDLFAQRHIGPGPEEARTMLQLLGYPSLDALIDEAIPNGILGQRRGLGSPHCLRIDGYMRGGKSDLSPTKLYSESHYS